MKLEKIVDKFHLLPATVGSSISCYIGSCLSAEGIDNEYISYFVLGGIAVSATLSGALMLKDYMRSKVETQREI